MLFGTILCCFILMIVVLNLIFNYKEKNEDKK